MKGKLYIHIQSKTMAKRESAQLIRAPPLTSLIQLTLPETSEFWPLILMLPLFLSKEYRRVLLLKKHA